VNQTARESFKTNSLSDTQVGGFPNIQPHDVEAGRGCVLQIYPATACAQIYRLGNRRTLIGREPTCDITLDDDAVSRSHATIELNGDRYLILDRGSRNGTFVDDKLLREQRQLTGGELIRMGGTILKFMAVMDQEAQYHAVVRDLMTRDPLTNAFNRSYLMSELRTLLTRCQYTQHCLAVIMIDIDSFKKVNDSHGHLIGDEVLRVFSERVRNSLRDNDQLCRFGGEEFVVICDRTNLQDAVRIAERIRLTVSSTPFSTNAGLIGISCSLGVMTLDHLPGASVDELLSRADQLMYAAKTGGRNCVRSPLDELSLDQ
jgi:two-component system cell cycle response regulator